MSPLFKKLNLNRQSVIHVLNAPGSFESELTALEGVAVKRAVTGKADFAMAFVTTRAQLEAASKKLAKACEGDAVLWMVYPKGSSKKYKCEFNRDSGWPTLGAAGFEPVRLVAIDEDWSALRFRRVEHIKTMSRDPAGAISSAGKRKASRPPFTLERLDHLVLRVQDLEGMIGFYCAALGCSVARRRDDLGLVHMNVGASMIDLISVGGKLGKVGGAPPGREGRNQDHLCVKIAPFDEQGIIDHLATLGVKPHSPATINFGAEGNGPSLYFSDPEGNVIELKGPTLSDGK